MISNRWGVGRVANFLLFRQGGGDCRVISDFGLTRGGGGGARETCLELESLLHLLACRVLLGSVPLNSSVQSGHVFLDVQPAADGQTQTKTTLRYSQLLVP